MTELDFEYAEILIKKERQDEEKEFEKYLSKEQEVRALCDELISRKSEEAWEKLTYYITQNETGSYVVKHTNWGRVLLLACKIYNVEKNLNFVSKIANLEQLLYIMRNFRFLNYRYQCRRDKKAKDMLYQLFDSFMLTEKQQKEILQASMIG